MHLHTAPVVLTFAGPPIQDAGVLVEDGRIVAVGGARDLAPRASTLREHEGVLMPGFVNAHAHLQYGPAFADLSAGGHAFPDWLLQMTERRKAMTDDGWRNEVAASWEQAHATGTVAVADIVTSVAALDVAVPGVRYLESVAVPSAGWAAEKQRMEALLAAHPEAGVSPHTLYTLGTTVIKGLIELARRHGRRIHPHLAETKDEDAFIREGEGPFAAWPFATEIRDAHGTKRSPAQHLNDIGGLGADVHVAHGTHLDSADRQMLRERRTAVALCARSNEALGSGTPSVAALLRENNPIAVGTDSLASTPDLDMLNEIRALAAIARSQGYNDDDLAARLLRAATQGGATAIGRPDLGALAPTKTAALVHVDIESPRATDIANEILRTGRAQAVVPERAAQQADSTP